MRREPCGRMRPHAGAAHVRPRASAHAPMRVRGDSRGAWKHAPMMLAVDFYTFVLAAHIAAIVIAFGVTFAYPVMYAVGVKREPRSMPGFHRIQDTVGKTVITPFLALALLCGIYLASDHKWWDFFFVQWGFAVIILVGAL